MKKHLFYLLFFALAGCEPLAVKPEFHKFDAIVSSDGHKAYIYEAESEIGEVTQVMVEFAGSICGAGALSTYQRNAGFKLSWLNGHVLVVEKPKSVKVQLNASGSKLRCNEKVVEV